VRARAAGVRRGQRLARLPHVVHAAGDAGVDRAARGGPHLRLLPHHGPPRLQDLPDVQRRAEPRAGRLRARARGHARGPRAPRGRDRGGGAARRGVRLARPAAGAGRPAGGSQRDRGGADLGRHRLAGGGLAHDEARLPRRLRALPQRAVPARHLAGEGARAGRAADRVAVRLAPAPGAVRRDPARGRPLGAGPGPRGRLPAADDPHRRGDRPARGRPGAGHRREPGAGGLADAGEHRGHRRGGHHAGAAPAHRNRQDRDHRRGQAAGDLRDLDRAGRRLLHAAAVEARLDVDRLVQAGVDGAALEIFGFPATVAAPR